MEKRLYKYIGANMLAMFGMSCYLIADTFFISVAAGANGITALNLALPIYGAMFAMGSMSGIGSATKYSLLKSMGDKSSEEYFSRALLWTFLMSLVFLAAGVFCPDKVLTLMGADQEILGTGLPYMRTALCFAPAFMLNYIFTSFVRNDNDPNTAMAATLISCFSNIGLDYLFMFPLKMGMLGAAVATGISPVISMAVCMSHYLSKKNTIKLMRVRPDLLAFAKACALGISGFVGEISSGITTMVFNYILLDLSGNTAVAAYGVVANISLVGIALFNGIAQGLQPLASQAAGQGDEGSKRKIMKHSVIIGFVTALVLFLILVIFAKPVVNAFNSEQNATMAVLAVRGLRLYSIGFLIAVVNIVLSGFYGAVGNARKCTVISLSRGIFAIVIFAFVLSRIFGIDGVWLAFPAAELGTVLITRGAPFGSAK